MLDYEDRPQSSGSRYRAAGEGIEKVPGRRVVTGAAGALLLAGFVVVAVFSALVVATEPGFDFAAPGCVSDLAAPSGGQGGAVEWSQSQRANAEVIARTGEQMGVPGRGQWIALATAMQESTLNNLGGGDRDSAGLFQQRPSQGWGTHSQVTDPTYAARKFYEGLLRVPGWEAMPLTVAAQTVQRSGFPDAYAKWEQAAADLLTELATGTSPGLGGLLAGVLCEPGETTGGGTSTGVGQGASTAAQRALDFAAAQFGKPYVWGGAGPDGFDCSGLTMRAWQAAGVQLPRTSREQATAGQRVPLSEARPGDLVFWSRNGTIPGIHHVALYLGDDRIREAPTTGTPVRDRDLNVTSGSYDARRILPFVIRPGA
ncbi:C40 family peptidase [Pseudonocardia sp. ICBG601]|uniref:C40 family peptidase n=1 Tax=Pseudonocardia sp. ICBG601 TaxID=2846759 RepID=UPI001CF62580|nr:C40 family peptidase [Pseudonocardia sp. ICBG601]